MEMLLAQLTVLQKMEWMMGQGKDLLMEQWLKDRQMEQW